MNLNNIRAKMSIEYCLDNGYVKIIDVMPRENTEKRIAQCARISFDNFDVDKSDIEDKALVRYLYENYHTSPLEMVEFMFEIYCPQFVATHLHRHRTANINEQSQRYTEVTDDMYHPSSDIRRQSQTNKQGSIEDQDFHSDMYSSMKEAEDLIETELLPIYHDLVGKGVAKEIARAYLPRSMYTKMVYKMDANNLLKFLRLRTAPDAQKETRQYAIAMKNLVRSYIPTLIDCLDESMLAITLRKDELQCIRFNTYPISIRRKKEFMDKYEKFTRRKLFILIGYRRTGKDTLADALLNDEDVRSLYPSAIVSLPKLYRPIKLALADQLKQDVSEMLGITITDQNKDEKIGILGNYPQGFYLDQNSTIRDALIQHGTNKRSGNKDYWLNIILKKINDNFDRDVIITDCRFENEVNKFKSIKDRDVYTIRLFRDNVPIPDKSISSEHDLDKLQTDFLLCDTPSSYSKAFQLFC